MSKDKNLITLEATITQPLPSGKFKAKLENGAELIAHLSGKMRRYSIKILTGDKVKVEMSPYDLTKGRIVYREK